MIKHYLEIEIRYSIPRDEAEGNEYQQTCFSKMIHSDLFYTEIECAIYGNKIIEANRWMEQYPGHKGLILKRNYGYPLVAPTLKNGAQIFISVKSLEINDLITISTELQKFNIDKITTKL